ncbi:lysophospholipid acyltransferase family protein [Shimia haliotis]|uniref:KDO2-lipid IV(A) lauroyltransferase n=1 Tax=Shimia haliotis TaxID=1280847 RepID=A0A1I4AZ59_9RHOB|nr:lysophospholipid acyltransferase family protein [Shimia haliotis]SFK60969.1 KDO2-lipid IV(A) lauroyltransferase [Shimia haliotis]
MSDVQGNIGHKLSDLAIRAFLRLAKLLPYERRLRLGGWMATNVVAPVTGNRRRIRENLDLVMPELDMATRDAIVREVPNGMGRTLMELFSADEFLQRVPDFPLTGGGAEALAQAHEDGRAVMLVTGHFGNYDAMRGALISRGYRVGGLFKRMSNPFFHEYYVAAMQAIGEPLFERSRRGMTEMIRFLRSGGMVGIVLDQRMNDAPIVDFMGHPARTSYSAAELALKYNALVVPVYGVRQPDGSYVLETEAPIAHSTPEEMTQQLNASLERQVRAHPGQWMWTHNRWKNAGNETAADREMAKRRAKQSQK